MDTSGNTLFDQTDKKYYEKNKTIGLIKLRSKLTLPSPCIFKSSIKIKINLDFYFHTSFWCFKRFYEGLKGLHKTF